MGHTTCRILVFVNGCLGGNSFEQPFALYIWQKGILYGYKCLISQQFIFRSEAPLWTGLSISHSVTHSVTDVSLCWPYIFQLFLFHLADVLFLFLFPVYSSLCFYLFVSFYFVLFCPSLFYLICIWVHSCGQCVLVFKETFLCLSPVKKFIVIISISSVGTFIFKDFKSIFSAHNLYKKISLSFE